MARTAKRAKEKWCPEVGAKVLFPIYWRDTVAVGVGTVVGYRTTRTCWVDDGCGSTYEFYRWEVWPKGNWPNIEEA